MKIENRPVPGKTVWILLFFMTLLMGFPFLFYYKYSTTGRDLLKSVHLYAGDFGRSLCRYFEDISSGDEESVSRKLEVIPLIAGAGIEIYDEEGLLISKRNPRYIEYEAGESRLYEGIKKLIDPFRHGKEQVMPIDIDKIKGRLLRKALNGSRGVENTFASGHIGDRILYFSYPLWDYSQEINTVKGVILMEYHDAAASVIMQKQRNQFAVTTLIFGVLLICYVTYVLSMLVFPLRKIIRKSQAIENRTEYLLPANSDVQGKNEWGELTRHLDGIKKILENREQEMEEYLSEIRHILRNPLSNIKAALEGLMMGKQSEKDLSFSRIIQNNLLRIDKYISIYHSASEITTAKLPLETVYIDSFLEKTIQNYIYLAEKKKLRFLLRKSEGTLKWRGFYTPLNYACEQIINNAIDFSPYSGVILIESSSDVNTIVIRITDQGPGIPPGKEEEIFRQYVSFRSQTNGEHTGTGLSLSMKALRKIGGDLYAENDESGGAVFTIILPIHV